MSDNTIIYTFDSGATYTDPVISQHREVPWIDNVLGYSDLLHVFTQRNKIYSFFQMTDRSPKNILLFECWWCRDKKNIYTSVMTILYRCFFFGMNQDQIDYMIQTWLHHNQIEMDVWEEFTTSGKFAEVMDKSESLGSAHRCRYLQSVTKAKQDKLTQKLWFRVCEYLADSNSPMKVKDIAAYFQEDSRKIAVLMKRLADEPTAVQQTFYDVQKVGYGTYTACRVCTE